MKYLVTGGLGFIGSYLVKHLLSAGHEVHVMDSLSYAGDIERLKGCDYRWWYHDIRLPIPAVEGEFDYILHLAAETHVDRSIEDPLPFIMTNVLGTAHVLNYARSQSNLKALLYFSTDEVFGPAPRRVRFKEWDRYHSGNPYAATKAGGEELALAYHNTYGVPVIITHTMNVFGPYQHTEKFIPSTVNKLLQGEKVIIHANPSLTQAGSRFYIHASEVARAVSFVLANGDIGEKYNIVGEREVNNLELVQRIAAFLGVINPPYELVNFHSSRPGHDLRYALDDSKLLGLGWTPGQAFDTGLRATVRWYEDQFRR